jgi:hypothetical protein
MISRREASAHGAPIRGFHMYVDPTSGSIVLQVALAGILGAIVTIKQWWGKAREAVRSLLGGRKGT